jgi:hypothetical protein
VSLATAVLRAPRGLHAHRKELLSACVWKWTESHGKYTGCRYWTRAALAADSVRDLAHEHVVPRKLIVERLRALVEPDDQLPRNDVVDTWEEAA